MASDQSTAFLSASAVVAALGCLLVTATPVVAGPSRAVLGSSVTSGLLGLVFAGQNRRQYRLRSTPSVPAATLTTVFGGWFMLVPFCATSASSSRRARSWAACSSARSPTEAD